MSGLMAPFVARVQGTTVAVAAGADDNTVVRAPIAGTVTAVTYTPEALVTGADTNSRTISLINKGQSGAGAVVVATLALVAGVNSPAFDEKALTLSVVAGATTVAEGDILAFQSLHIGTGIADPGGLISVSIDR